MHHYSAPMVNCKIHVNMVEDMLKRLLICTTLIANNTVSSYCIRIASYIITSQSRCNVTHVAIVGTRVEFAVAISLISSGKIALRQKIYITVKPTKSQR